MALQKELEKDNTGVKVIYWRIVQITLNYDDKTLVADMAGYLTAEARQAEKNPVDSRHLVCEADKIADIRSETYDLLSEPIIVNEIDINEFTGSVDI